jgi:hypothetical protein
MAQTKRRISDLGFDELMIVNPVQAASGDLYMDDDGALYTVRPLLCADSPAGLFLADDGTLYRAGKIVRQGRS